MPIPDPRREAFLGVARSWYTWPRPQVRGHPSAGLPSAAAL